jgi:excisionase family DNA binding protein
MSIAISGGASIPPAPTFYTTDEVADLLKIHVKTVREMIKAKRLQAVKVGQEYRITEDQIRQFVEDNKTT